MYCVIYRSEKTFVTVLCFVLNLVFVYIVETYCSCDAMQCSICCHKVSVCHGPVLCQNDVTFH